jgi:hypothetical protein
MDNLSFDETIDEYKNSKALLHLITGIGIGVFLSGLFPMIFYQPQADYNSPLAPLLQLREG